MNIAKIATIGVLVLLGSLYVIAVMIALAPYILVVLIGAGVCGVIALASAGEGRSSNPPPET